jgi:hypothetical protein
VQHSQDTGKDLHQTMVQIQKSHEEEIRTLAQEILVRNKALHIITGGDQEMVNKIISEARERL